MAASLYISLKRDIEGVDPSAVDGKRAMHSLDSLNERCRELGLRPFGSFIAVSPDNLDFLEDEGESSEGIEEQWFSAKEGEAVVQALIADLKRSPRYEQGLADDLEGFSRVLSAAAKENVSFHFSCDF